MIEQDTVRLLRECDAGIRMGVDSIDEVMDEVADSTLRKCLTDAKQEHEKLEKNIQKMLEVYHDEGKDINPMVKTMSKVKTNVKLMMDGSDSMIADMIIDGCDMGVKSLHKYLNQYKAADEKSKNHAKELIHIEKHLAESLYAYL